MYYGPIYGTTPDPFVTILQALLPALSWMTLLYVGYAMVLMVSGLFRRYRVPVKALPRTRFAVIIPAHNEEPVLAPLLREIRAQRYPRHLVDIFVVADNCDDRTAYVAVANGATAFERHNLQEIGKGHAVQYALDRILAQDRHDAIVVIDADNLPDPEFLACMNNHLQAGEKIIQSRKDVKNPNDGVLAAVKTMLVWTSNRFWFVAKDNLHCSGVLLGSGMCVATSVIRDIGWDVFSLTEDFQFTAKALLNDYQVYWADEAIIYEEEPTRFDQIWRQHVRWSRGQNWVLVHYGPQLFIKGLLNADFVKVEGALQLFQSLFPIVTLVLGLVSFWGGTLGVLSMVGPIPSWVWIVASLLQYSAPYLAYRLDYQKNPWPLRYIWLYPLLTYSWVFVNIYALFTCRTRGWHVTEHTRPLSLAEVARGQRN